MAHESPEAASSAGEGGDGGGAYRDLMEIIEERAVYPVEAYQFVQEGLSYALERFNPGFNPSSNPGSAGGPTGVGGVEGIEGAGKVGEVVFPAKPGSAKDQAGTKKTGGGGKKSSKPGKDPQPPPGQDDPGAASRHITGKQLSIGLREYAWLRWGLMARTVLGRWNVTSTLDFGKIVFALVEAGLLSTTESDRLEDFLGVYDFRSLETDYVMGTPAAGTPEGA